MRISDWSSDVCSSDLALQIREMAAQFGELVILRDPQPHDRHALRRRDDDILALVADAGEQVVGAAVGPQRRGPPGRARPVEPDVDAISRDRKSKRLNYSH